jgi:hypothetical protein
MIFDAFYRCFSFSGIIAMPSKSPKQKRTMAGAAHDPAFAKKVGIPVSVAKEFNQADAASHGDGDDDSGQDADTRHPQDASQGCSDADEAKKNGASKAKKKSDDQGRHGGPAAQFGLPRSAKKPPASKVVLR